MDPLTQAVFGVNAALLVKGRAVSPPAAVIAGAAAGMAPDLDILIRSTTDPLLTIEYHRFFTHSIFFVPVGGLLVAISLWWLLRRYTDWFLGSFRRWFIISAAAMLTHAPLDMCTSYGTSFLWPLSDARLDWSVVAVIDPLVTLPMLGLLVLGWRKRKHSLVIASAFYACSYLMVGAYHQRVAESVVAAVAHERGHAVDHIEAKPAIFVNFLWRTIYEYQGFYYVDAVRVKRFGEPVFYQGSSVAVFDSKKNVLDVDKASQHFRDVERFEHFSQGMTYQVPGRPDLIADIRYSMVPNQIDPLWAIKLNTSRSHQHVEYVVFRDITPEKKTTFWRMLMGELL